MTKKHLPDIYLNRQTIVTTAPASDTGTVVLHDHSKDGIKNDGYLSCQDAQCREQLIRMGGVLCESCVFGVVTAGSEHVGFGGAGPPLDSAEALAIAARAAKRYFHALRTLAK